MDHQIMDGEYLNKKEAKLRFRQEIIWKWRNRCAYCNLDLGRSATLDHVLAKSRGGHTHPRNLIPACLSCNVRKASREWREWFREQDFWDQRLEVEIEEWIDPREVEAA
jgi:5-methylcytosine-specific restriction endonuclease McrA